MRLLLLTLALCAGSAQAHEVITTKITWSKEISRLMYNRCAGCHREGGKAPMSLMTYDDVRPWAKAIKEEVLERRMPPGSAVKGFGEIVNDHSLTQDEVTTIAEWVEGGAPEGNKLHLPKTPNIPEWKEPARPAGTSSVTVAGKLKLTQAANVVAIRPVALPDKAEFQVIATRPDGSVEPLLWMKRFDKPFARTYQYREPVVLPAGTVVEVMGPSQATLSLFVKAPATKKVIATGSH
jgi:hypothetical protein